MLPLSQKGVVRPSAASLNSLLEVLRQAQPLYRECRSILSHLDGGAEIMILTPSPGLERNPDGLPASKDVDAQPDRKLEPIARSRNSIMYGKQPVPLSISA
jgi:hypothetical protein